MKTVYFFDSIYFSIFSIDPKIAISNHIFDVENRENYGTNATDSIKISVVSFHFNSNLHFFRVI